MGITTIKAEPPPGPASRPASPWRALRSELDRAFSGFGDISDWGFAPARLFAGGAGSAAPALDFTEGDADYKLTAELPGLTEADFSLSLANDRLTLSGEKHDQHERKMGQTHYSERAYGSFQRALLLPADVDQARISADFKNGVLVVTLPKTEAVRPKAIKVNAG